MSPVLAAEVIKHFLATLDEPLLLRKWVPSSVCVWVCMCVCLGLCVIVLISAHEQRREGVRISLRHFLATLDEPLLLHKWVPHPVCVCEERR